MSESVPPLDQQTLERDLAPLFPDGVAFAVKLPGAEVGAALAAVELALLPPGAVLSRQQEFRLGRLAAHQALVALLGQPAGPIRRGGRGEPLWPVGVVGAISHTRGIALAAVARRECAVGLGLDVERRERRLDPGVARRVCTPAEQQWIAGGEDAGQRLIRLISAKESVFKAFYPLEAVYLNFLDAELLWQPERQGFRARLLTRAAAGYPAGHEAEVRCAILTQHVVTFLHLPAAAR